MGEAAGGLRLMAPPNLHDPAEREAYRRELRGVARGVRLAGLWLGAAGLLLVLAAQRGLLSVPLWVAFSVTGFGVMLMITGTVARTKYHALRMRG
jgi:uncharacterized RDD family membrane protein YckC